MGVILLKARSFTLQALDDLSYVQFNLLQILKRTERRKHFAPSIAVISDNDQITPNDII